jgi:hypothetical protein
MTSQIRVDSIVPTTGVPTGGGGGIIQIVQNVQGIGTIESDDYPTASEYDIGLNCTITPKTSDSKILINANWSALQNGILSIDYYLSRGTTHIHMIQNYQGLSGSWTASFPNMMYLDSPSTTSPVTYKISAKVSNNQYLYTNYNYTAADDTTVHGELTGYGSRSTMILMEVSG